MNIPGIQKLFNWYGKKTVVVVLIGIIALIVLAVVLKKADQTEPEVTATSVPTVETASVGTLSGSVNWTVIGQVEAVSRAEVKSETSGRIISVSAKLGDTLPAGAIIAQIENASERAAVLQAEGAYEAAQAAASQGDLGTGQAITNLETAKNNLQAAQNAILNLNRTAYTTNNQILLESIDNFFTNPIRLEARLNIDGRTKTDQLINERTAFRMMFPSWQTATTDTIANPRSTLNLVEANTKRVLTMVDIFIELLPRADENFYFTTAELAAELDNFNSIRSQLVGIIAAVEQNRTALNNAEKVVENASTALQQAEIGGTGSEVSTANAQVKQALGSLRSAQANLAKTIIRTPIAGEINSIDINIGDFVAPQSIIAEVANNKALEITAFVGEADRNQITEGQIVMIDGQYEGVVTTIASAINQNTKKYEVKIATENDTLANGATVTIESTTEVDTASTELYIPITAVKFTDTNGSVYFVEDSILVARPVTIGRISGSSVEITDGITSSDMIVIDARGLVVGQQVEVTNG